eukprot:CAMPEP_0174719986 /NCGR_PEP_ID=MMETSP1094-20130205/32505_1 /TAXON_ID=156173 /ORGANISM="Chrysochromulina brevifilum, Strain UTEX LB 985" /LENGTH=139 /DNA_ID=CAMNT_0015920401 /DNA_START=264 /DNA_END=685 /DNA_ORIENTATION=+
MTTSAFRRVAVVAASASNERRRRQLSTWAVWDEASRRACLPLRAAPADPPACKAAHDPRAARRSPPSRPCRSMLGKQRLQERGLPRKYAHRRASTARVEDEAGGGGGAQGEPILELRPEARDEAAVNELRHPTGRMMCE